MKKHPTDPTKHAKSVVNELYKRGRVPVKEVYNRLRSSAEYVPSRRKVS